MKEGVSWSRHKLVVGRHPLKNGKEEEEDFFVNASAEEENEAFIERSSWNPSPNSGLLHTNRMCAHRRRMLDDDHFNSVPARLVSVFPFNSWPVHQHVSQIEKTCYPRPEDKQVRV